MSAAAPDPLLVAIELHSADGIRSEIASGIDPDAPINGQRPTDHLIQMYTRSERFAHCFRTLLELGAAFADEAVRLTLLDDGQGLSAALRENPAMVLQRVSLPSAYTSLFDVSLLHVAAEFGNLRAARALIDAGADIESRAGVDSDGFGRHTPIFHTVNSNRNHCEPVLRLLLAAGAAVDVFVDQVIWGRDLPWETPVFDVTPISYAMMGLSRQFHREEKDVYSNIALMLDSVGRKVAPFRNVPNRYLTPENET
ncbi:hypothetical protein OT109_17445 [Phycisphaeraceae bacterium D3-23]